MSHSFTLLSRLLSILLLATRPTLGFELTFPTPSHYWVACGWNNITWRSSHPDPSTVTLMLTHPNKTLLNDDFAIGNAVQGSDNAAMVYVPCLTAAEGYEVMFVNASGYGHEQNKVIYTSPQFPIKPKGTAPDPASGQTSIPSEIHPYLHSPGIVIPAPDKLDQLTNTTATSNNTSNDALPRLDASAASFGSFQPGQPANAAAREVVNDVLFVVVVTAFTVLVVTS